MSNKWAVTTKPIGTQHATVIQRIDRSTPYYLRENGEPKTFPSEKDAELAGHRHILDLLNKECRFERAPAKKEDFMALQESVFGTVTSRAGDQTLVERRRRRRPTRRPEDASDVPW